MYRSSGRRKVGELTQKKHTQKKASRRDQNFAIKLFIRLDLFRLILAFFYQQTKNILAQQRSLKESEDEEAQKEMKFPF